MPVPKVLRIDDATAMIRVGRVRAHPVRGTRDDPTVERLERPGYRSSVARLHQLDGEPVEQVGMRWWGAVAAEVMRGGHQGSAEMPAPDVVDRDAGGQRIATVVDPAGQRRPPSRTLTW